MSNSILYAEKISSKRTEALFIALMVFFFVLFIWRVQVIGLNVFAGVLLFFCGLFFFYTVNFRVLTIQLTAEMLTLTFGIFTWRVPLENIAACELDEIPPLMKFGGAGIHFMFIRKRYRASFNFLEYPRVVLAFKRKTGPVQDISFSTRQPNEVLALIGEAVSAKYTGERTAHGSHP